MSPAHLATFDLGAVAAVLADQGIERASAAVLARAAGVAKPTLYARYGSRDGVVEACVQHEAERLLDALFASDDPGTAVAVYARRSPGWPLVLQDRHPIAVAARTRIASRIAEWRGGVAGMPARTAASAFLAAAGAIVAREPAADREQALCSLARALIPARPGSPR
ncbi:MAG: TetR family transcriptional regulator [Thermoleophilaceae bacterium]